MFGEYDRTAPVENVTRLETQDNEISDGASAEELSQMSTSDRLSNAFDYAGNRQGFRESGGKGGNTTGDEMDILEYEDGSRDFATPVNAYRDISTGVVSSPERAVENNQIGPILINQLGGNAAQTDVIEDESGERHIVKEGIEGETVSDYRLRGKNYTRDEDIDTEEFRESASETMAAAYFTGNMDLHGGNLIINAEENAMYVIDFDSGGYDGTSNKVEDIDRTFMGNVSQFVDSDMVREFAYDKALEIREDDTDPQNIQRTDMGQYMLDAADKAARQAYIDEDYEYGDAKIPEELRSGPPDIDSIEDVRDPNDDPRESYRVQFVDNKGSISEGEVRDVVDGTIEIRRDDYRTSEVENVNQLIEVQG